MAKLPAAQSKGKESKAPDIVVRKVIEGRLEFRKTKVLFKTRNLQNKNCFVGNKLYPSA